MAETSLAGFFIHVADIDVWSDTHTHTHTHSFIVYHLLVTSEKASKRHEIQLRTALINKLGYVCTQ